MNTPTPDQLDHTTIDLIFCLRDSLTDDGPSRLDFWDNRVTTAIEAAAAGADTAPHAISIAARKLQIGTFAAAASHRIQACGDVIDQDYTAWSAHVARNLPYIVALAKIENKQRKADAKAIREAEEALTFDD